MKIFNGFLIGYLNACSISNIAENYIHDIDEKIAKLTVRVDELAVEQEASELRADAIENSLVNNNLLTSCTIQGHTDDWRTAQEAGAFEVEVDVSNTRLSKIDRINTWLTCLYGCPNANGSNNIKRVPTEDFKFWVVLHRDQALTDWSLQQIQGAQFKIHYEVEGPCAENEI